MFTSKMDGCAGRKFVRKFLVFAILILRQEEKKRKNKESYGFFPGFIHHCETALFSKLKARVMFI